MFVLRNLFFSKTEQKKNRKNIANKIKLEEFYFSCITAGNSYKKKRIFA